MEGPRPASGAIETDSKPVGGGIVAN
jgi:hypothetical protein